LIDRSDLILIKCWGYMFATQQEIICWHHLRFLLSCNSQTSDHFLSKCASKTISGLGYISL